MVFPSTEEAERERERERDLSLRPQSYTTQNGDKNHFQEIPATAAILIIVTRTTANHRNHRKLDRLVPYQ